MLSLIQEHLSLATETPLLLVSWLSLVAFEDLPEFSDVTGVSAEQLIQSLLYRLRKCGERPDLKKEEENLKVKNQLTNINLQNDLVPSLIQSSVITFVLPTCSMLRSALPTSS